MAANQFKLFKLDDEIIGKTEEIANQLYCCYDAVMKSAMGCKDLNGHKIEYLGVFTAIRIYRILYDGEIIFEGTAEEVANKFGYKSKQSVINSAKKGMLGEYTIRFSREEFIKIK